MTDFLKRTDLSNVDFSAAIFNDSHFIVGNTNCDNGITSLQASLQLRNFDVFILPGDLIWNNNTDGITKLNSMLSPFSQPKYCVKGNHDDTDYISFGMPSNYYTIDHGTKWKGIYLYSQEGGNYNFGATQRSWLSTQLATARSEGRFVFIVSHVPINPEGTYAYFEAVGYSMSSALSASNADTHQDAKEVIDIIKPYNDIVKIWFSGHEHTYTVVEKFGIKFWNNGAASSNWWGLSAPLLPNYHPKGYSVHSFLKNGFINSTFIYY